MKSYIQRMEAIKKDLRAADNLSALDILKMDMYDYHKTLTERADIILKQRITFRSNHGEVVVAGDGVVETAESSLSNCLLEIVKVNLDEMFEFEKSIGEEENQPSYDILNVGYWSKDGSYEEPVYEWRAERRAPQN